MMQKAEEEKQRIRNGGLAYLMGEAKKWINGSSRIKS
jgi:hypothetical protein